MFTYGMLLLFTFKKNRKKKNKPSISLGKRFASPKKSWTGRAKRAKTREAEKSLFGESSSSNSQHSTIVLPTKQDMPSTA